jgi:hypothetical protein
MQLNSRAKSACSSPEHLAASFHCSFSTRSRPGARFYQYNRFGHCAAGSLRRREMLLLSNNRKKKAR